MASAGQAQAHSSHPMHFSRPSGCRLRMCRPWERGAATGCSNGYFVVTTLRNMCAKVTPKPLTESVMAPISVLLLVGVGNALDGGGADVGRLPLGDAPDGPWVRWDLQVQRWQREAPGRPVRDLLLEGRYRLGRRTAEQPGHDDEGHRRPADDQP